MRKSFLVVTAGLGLVLFFTSVSSAGLINYERLMKEQGAAPAISTM